MRAERNERKIQVNLQNKFDFMQKQTFSIPQTMKTTHTHRSEANSVFDVKRRPEFKSFFHKSFRKTDYSIIPLPRTHK